MIEYKDYIIEPYKLNGRETGKYAVFYWGDEVVFDSIEEAKDFIDKIEFELFVDLTDISDSLLLDSETV
ncbi:MAG: hypothetical protein IK121_10990, partial [Lachnospiraceae bacterium]|nr:hypothetical protein [Lachnospiraceae bacterium]